MVAVHFIGVLFLPHIFALSITFQTLILSKIFCKNWKIWLLLNANEHSKTFLFNLMFLEMLVTLPNVEKQHYAHCEFQRSKVLNH